MSQTFLFLCGGVDTHEKIVYSDSILASLTLLAIADEYLFLQGESGVALYFSSLKANLSLQWDRLPSLLVIPPTLRKPARLIAYPLCRLNKSVPAFG